MDQSFGSEHRLKSKKLITQLFKDGNSYKSFPIIGVVTQIEENATTQIGFSVSKKRFASAVDRNLIKRQMREAVRHGLGKGSLSRTSGLALMLIYVDKQFADFKGLEKAISKLLSRVTESYERDIEQF